MRIEHNGHWAELGDKPLTWGERNSLRSASSKDFFVDFAPALVTQAVASWGEPGDCKDPLAWGPVDPEFGDKVFQAALDLWKAKVGDDSTDPTEQPSES